MRIKKIAQSIGSLGKVLNTHSTSTENTYSCNYINDILATIYPVGSIIIKDDSTDYSNWLGFTWQKVFDGKVLVGQDTSDTDFDAIGETGGEKTHTLTVNEMPSHNHKHRQWVMNGSTASGNHYGFGYQSNTGIPIDTESYATTGEVQYGNYPTGGSQAHNNMPPYQVVAYWKRIS